MKVFLVEDEYIVREGIKNNIDWEKNGYDFCGEASDGELAFPMISEKRPDIVITDIRMPGYNGVDVIRIGKEYNSDIQFIIISGYSQFDYAQNAIHYGVSDYLLKPVKAEELTKALLRI